MFSTCIPIQGFRRSIITDINRHQVFFIPNVLYTLLHNNQNRTLKEIIEHYDKNDRETILSFFEVFESSADGQIAAIPRPIACAFSGPSTFEMIANEN